MRSSSPGSDGRRLAIRQREWHTAEKEGNLGSDGCFVSGLSMYLWMRLRTPPIRRIFKSLCQVTAKQNGRYKGEVSSRPTPTGVASPSRPKPWSLAKIDVKMIIKAVQMQGEDQK